MKRINLILAALVLVIAALPLLPRLAGGPTPPFTGADAQAQAVITQAHPDYRPWFSPLWEPPSGEVTSFLFALQAALGAGLLGYYLGLRRGRAQRRDADAADATD